MQLWRRQLRSQIADPQLREKCVSDYVMGCKRVLFSNNWYSTGRDNGVLTPGWLRRGTRVSRSVS